MADTTLQDLSNKLDHIAELTLIGSKTVLNIEEAALFTGLSVGHIYRLTSGKKIPHFKKQRELFRAFRLFVFFEQRLQPRDGLGNVPDETETDGGLSAVVRVVDQNLIDI